MYLYVYHGRSRPDEHLNDWGFCGPILGPLEAFVCTYMSSWRAIYKLPADASNAIRQYKGLKWWDEYANSVEIEFVDDMLYLDGRFFGDWELGMFSEEKVATINGEYLFLRERLASCPRQTEEGLCRWW